MEERIVAADQERQVAHQKVTETKSNKISGDRRILNAEVCNISHDTLIADA